MFVPMPDHAVGDHGTWMRWADRRWRWNDDTWVEDDGDATAWATRAPRIEIDPKRPPRELAFGAGDEVQAFSTPDTLVVVRDGNDLLLRAWDRFLATDAAVAGTADVRGVALDDTLNVRAGPHSAARIVATLSPGARCVRVLEGASTLSGARWEPVETADGTRGWVNAKFLHRNTACPST
jgi:SH3-like domain-containing protein